MRAWVKYLIPAILVLLAAIFFLKFGLPFGQQAQLAPSNELLPNTTPSTNSTKDIPTKKLIGITPENFATLPSQDQENIRQLVQDVRRYGTPNITPEDCSIITIGAIRFSITSYWDKDYTRDPNIWNAPEEVDLWNPNIKSDVLSPGSWMIAYLSTDKKARWPNSLIRWASPPSTVPPPAIPIEDPIGQAANTAWNAILEQNYELFSFVKVTSYENVLQLHFTVVVNNHTEKRVASVPIEGPYDLYTLGPVTIHAE